MMFASKTPAEPRREYMECRHGDYPEGDGNDYCVICSPVWIEHPHVQHNEPNPILVAFRERGDAEYPEAWVNASWAATAFGGYPEWNDERSYFHVFTAATDAQIIHARRVLNLLKSLAAVTT